MKGTHANAVVVGVDRSGSSQSAIRYAADLATRLHRPLRVVHAYETSSYSVRPQVNRPTVLAGVFRNSAERLCAEAVEVLTAFYPDLEVTTRLQPGLAVETLLEESEQAQVVVLGRRGSGGFSSLLVGSTTLHVAAHAGCTVVAVPSGVGSQQLRQGVVVGVDGSEASGPAIGYAFETASELGEPLTAVHSWFDSMSQVGFAAPGLYYPTSVEDEKRMDSDERLLLAESIAGWSEKYPDVAVQQKTVHQHSVQALVEEAGQARLVVVGCRGRGTLRRLAMGSVSHGVLHHASGPVAIVR